MLDRLTDALFAHPGRWLIAGLAATLVLAVFMEGIAPLVIGGPLKPAQLICQVLGWDESLLWLAEVIHYALGLVGFPAGFVVLQAISRFGFPVLAGALWGVALWVGAGAVMAPLAGMAPFFGGGTVMTASLVAHLAYGVVLGAVFGRDRTTKA